MHIAYTLSKRKMLRSVHHGISCSVKVVHRACRLWDLCLQTTPRAQDMLVLFCALAVRSTIYMPV
jgi:hypothetical protein